jgi:TetR/AcrR family transcriptional repressor of nem operon
MMGVILEGGEGCAADGEHTMSKASQADAAIHREEVVAAASRLLRERGAAGISVSDVMSAAGLTHGGFYKHFSSKDELVGIAASEAFDGLLSLMDRLRSDIPDRATAKGAMLDDYLSAEHRDNPGDGCANTGLASDAARASAESPLRRSYRAGVEKTLAQLTGYEADAADPAEARRQAIGDLATMVGALTLARATAGDALSDEILEVVREQLEAR